MTPNKLGWKTVCLLDKGFNIHAQNFEIQEEYLPKFKITEIKELKSIIEELNS